MEAMFKQIAIIKEEYGCTNKELQLVTRSTARFNDSVHKMELSLHEMSQQVEEEKKQLIVSQMELDDAEVSKTRLEEQLQVARARKVEALASLASQEALRLSLASEIHHLKSPEDYRAELLSRLETLDLKKQELAAEQKLSKQLQARLEELRQTAESKKQITMDIAQIRQLRTSVLTEITTLERKQVNDQDPALTIQQLQQQLQDAQDRFQYLCSHQRMME